MESTKTVFSPLTDNDNVTRLKTFSTKEIVLRWKDEFNIDITSEFTGQANFSLYRCLTSNLMFFEPKISGTPDLYKQLQDIFDWYYLDDKWEYQIAIKELKNFKNVIEIGCGKGTFIKKILRKNNHNIIGLETSPAAVEEATKSNLPVYESHLSDYLNQNKNFVPDAIISFQVLEHIDAPLKFLKESIEALKIGGKLIICVPNQDCFYKYSDELLDMPPHHITKWSIASFRYLEKILPIKLTKIKTEPLYHMHSSLWLKNQCEHFRKQKWYGKLLFNRFSIPIIKTAIRKDFVRSFLKGHTLYVSFVKTRN